jgi:DNA invertase Pin-like site-specific DNA recombinase
MTVFGPSEWFSKAVPLAYTRISDNQQSKEDKSQKESKKKPALKEQFQFIQSRMKGLKLPAVKNENWFAEVESGTNRERSQWRELMARATELAHQGKRSFIVVQDPSRWARNSRHSMVAIDRMHEIGVPVFAVREGIQTGSVGDLHPTEELLFVQLQGGASFVSQEQKKKADQSVEKSKEEGVIASKGQSLFPFARMDPLDAYFEQLPLLTVPTNEGGGPTAFKGVLEGMTAPNGIPMGSVPRFMKAEEERRKKLTDEEYQAWYDYRKKIRNLLIELDHDPFARQTREGKINWGARALMRHVGRYLAEPWKFNQRSDEEIEDYLKNPKQYLGTKDLQRYRGVVGKR